jgi:hypothetical protein
MAHEILGERFFNKSRELAWHKLGLHTEEEISAVEALRRIGEPIVTLEPIVAEIGSSKLRLELPDRAIVRHPIPDVEGEDEYVRFGIVGPEYQLITAGQLALIADEHVAKPVETMGFLRRGSIFFASFNLPAIDVKGDEIECYLGCVAPMDGLRSASVERWLNRVVCANTWTQATANSPEKYMVVHDGTALERLGTWMGEMYAQAVAEVELVQEALTLLADHKATVSDATKVATAAWPDPKQPRSNAPSDVMQVRSQRHELLTGYMQKRRDAAIELFKGRATGFESKAFKGTMFGAFQSVVEVETFRRGQGEITTAEQNVIGRRAETKRRALDTALQLVGVPRLRAS